MDPGGGGFSHGGFGHDGGHDPGVFGHDPGGFHPDHHHGGVDGSGLGHQGGHGDGQSFDSNSYANAFGGHTHHHGGFGQQLAGHDGTQGHGGQQGGIIAQLLGLNQGHHGLLATFLGLDGKHQYVHQTPPEVTRQGQFLWENLGRTLKSDLFNEFELTPGKLFVVLIAAMIGWLFVLNFTRSHEPQVNAMLGANVAQVAAYESTDRLNQPNQKPIELPTNSVYSFYLQPNKFTLSRMLARQGQGFVSQEQQVSPAAPEPAATGVLNQRGVVTQGGLVTQEESNGTSAVKTADGRIQTIVNR
jgi:hypothetical protein